MDLVAGVVGATVAIDAAVGVFFLLVRARRREDEEFLPLGLLCVVLAGHSAARLAEASATSPADVLAASRFASVALIAAMVLLVHFALDYARPASRRAWLIFAYAAGAAYELMNARGLLHDVQAFVSVRPGVAAPHVAPMSGMGVSLYGIAVVTGGGALALFARAYLAGRREALALVVGVTLLIATLLNDVGYVAGVFATMHLAPVGFFALVSGAAVAFASRYVDASRDAARRAAEVKSRTRELRKALADLGAAQEELGRKEQLAVVGELAAVIAHEVRNPLAIIANAVAGLRKPTLTRDDQGTLLSILEEETTRLNRLVSDLLRYARPVNLQRQSISLRDLLERGLQLANNRKSLQVELKVEATDMRLWGDSNLLRQVFENLIDNAMQAMHYGGLLTVRVRAMQHEAKDGLAVDIIDTGEGMDTIVRSRARDPFFTTRPSGTGLGLAIVDRIVDAHGGHFLIESRAGEGTTATVFLPAGSPSEPPPMRARSPSLGRRDSNPDTKRRGG